jgi:hypothetical protein
MQVMMVEALVLGFRTVQCVPLHALDPWPTYLVDCRKNSTITVSMQSLCQLQQNQNEHQKNKCGHNFVSVTHNISDHHIHHQQ